LMHPCATPFACLGRGPPVRQRNKTEENEQAQNVKTVNGFHQSSLGRFISGKPLLLHYDTEYRDEDADFEACMPVRQRKDIEGISVRELPAGQCISLVHQGPYDQLGRSYAGIFEYQKCTVILPTREVYLKGPGMLFKGNPKNYITEIQILVETERNLK